MRLPRSSRVALVGANILLLAVGTCVAGSDQAQSKATGGAFAFEPVRVAAGGAKLGGASWSLWATVGQHEAAFVSARGGTFELEGGLHAVPDGAKPDAVFSSGFE
jgi:hypothetical protein